MIGKETLGARAAEGTKGGWGALHEKAKRRYSAREMFFKAAEGTAASYRETKQYLIDNGYSTQEVLDAPNTFHLRNIAQKAGLDLLPLEAKYSVAASAALAAQEEKEEAIAREEAAAEVEREANAAAAEAQEAAENATIAAAARASRRSVSQYLSWIEEGEARAEVQSRVDAQVDISEVTETIQESPLQVQLRQEADAVEVALAEAEAAAAKRRVAEREIEEAKMAEQAEAEERAIRAAQEAAKKEAEAMDAAKEAASRQVVAAAAAEVQRAMEEEKQQKALQEAKDAEATAVEAARAAAERQEAARAAANEIRKLAAERTKDAERADAALTDAQDTLARERAALFIQAMVRRWLQSSVFFHAWSSVVTLQKRFRSRLVRGVFRRMHQYLVLLKAGALFLQLPSDGGPPQERYIWLDADLKTLRWSAPAKPKSALETMLTPKLPTASLDNLRAETRRRTASKKPLKAQDQLLLSGCRAVTQGTQRSQSDPGRLGSAAKSSSRVLSALKRKPKSNEQLVVDPNRCLSLIGNDRTLQLVAPSQRVRDDWMWALRLMVSHWTVESSFQGIRGQREMMGIDDKVIREIKIRALDVLGAEYFGMELQVVRSANGMGVVLDAACNVVVELVPEGAGSMAGLCVGDVVMFVDGVAVTAIENGYIVPMSLVVSAINPSNDTIKLTCFRAHQGAPLVEEPAAP